MKIVVIGASGTLGRAVVAELQQGGAHEIIRVGRTRGDHQVDITDADSVAALFDKLGCVDAIVSTAGNLFFGPLTQMRAVDFNLGLQDKLLGQVRLALAGQHHLNDGGSITLTTGRRPGADRAGRQRHGGERRRRRLRAGGRLRVAARHPHQRRQPDRADRIDGDVRSVFSRLRKRAGGARGDGVSAQCGRGAERAGVPGRLTDGADDWSMRLVISACRSGSQQGCVHPARFGQWGRRPLQIRPPPSAIGTAQRRSLQSLRLCGAPLGIPPLPGQGDSS